MNKVQRKSKVHRNWVLGLVLIANADCLLANGDLEASSDRPAAAAHHGPRPADAGWRLIWRDEFDGIAIDPGKWSHDVDCAGGGNQELQCYTDRPVNSFIKDGMLHLVAREERFSGPKYSASHPKYDRNDTSKTQPFTSARVHTRQKFDFTYGRIDVRAKVAAGKGLWSAIWMLPTKAAYGTWPLSGEIDIMEALNAGIDPDEVHGTLHYGLPWPQWENKVQGYHLGHSPADQFHVYALEWEADEIRWYVDGEHYQTQTSEGWYNYVWQGQEQGFQIANPRAPFDQAFHLIINVAVGGNWPGDPDRNWPADRRMLIDYVRAYQCTRGDPNSREYTGEGCATVNPAVRVNQDTGAPGTHQFALYKDGPETLLLPIEGSSIGNALAAGVQEAKTGRVRQANVEANGERGLVWDLNFKGVGAVFLRSADLSSKPGHDSGMVLAGGSGWTNNGEVKFDLLVIEASPDSQLRVKLKSGDGQAGTAEIRIPKVGQWRPVSVKLADILKNPRPEDGGVDIANLQYPFTLEYQGFKAHFQVDNVRLKCAYNTEPETWQIHQSCGLAPRKTPPEPVFVSINDQQWSAWDCCGGATFSQVRDEMRQRDVVEFRFEAKPTAPGFSAPRSLDLSGFKNGDLEFDFREMTPPADGSQWYLKMEGDTTAAQVKLTDSGPAPSRAWQHYVIPLKGKMEDVDMSTIRRILIFPEWGNAQGAAMRIENLKFVVP